VFGLVRHRVQRVLDVKHAPPVYSAEVYHALLERLQPLEIEQHRSSKRCLLNHEGNELGQCSCKP
jgi:hypothetical protein